MFAQNTRISNDEGEVHSYENQVDSIGRYVFQNRYEDSCRPGNTYISQCHQNQVGENQVDHASTLRMQPTSLNELSKIKRTVNIQVPYKVGGGYIGEGEDVSREAQSGANKYQMKYYNPRMNYPQACDTTVEQFVRGGISTRACYRNAKIK